MSKVYETFALFLYEAMITLNECWSLNLFYHGNVYIFLVFWFQVSVKETDTSS